MSEIFVNSKIYQVLRALLNIGFWIGIVVSLFLLILSILNLVGGKNSVINSFQLNFDGFTLNQASFSKTESFNLFFFFTTLLTIAVGLLCVWMLRNIVNSLADASPFTQKNVSRIRVIGWVLFAQAYLRQLMNYLFAQQLSNAYLPNGTQSVIQPHFTFIPDGVLLALCILILAEVFRYGCILQNEHDTTI